MERSIRVARFIFVISWHLGIVIFYRRPQQGELN